MKRRLAMAITLAALLVVTFAPASALDEADRLFMVGERALTDRFYPVARRALERFVAQYPQDQRVPRAMLLLGQARLALNDPQSALDAFSRAATSLTAPADQLEAKFWQGESLFRLKRFAEARTAYDEIVRTNAASPLAGDALYGVAWTELELKRPEPAVIAFHEFLAAWPQHPNAPMATIQLARGLIDLKRLGEAQPVLRDFATKYPKSELLPEAQYLLGWVKVNNGDPRGGLADLRAFVAANPNHANTPAARKLVAQALAKYGDRQEQIDSYNALIAQPSPTPEDLYEAAQAATRLSRPKDAETAWRKLKAQYPDHALTGRLSLELANTAFKAKNYKDAATLAQGATQSGEDVVRADAWLTIGESELKLKRFPQAAKAFEAVGTVEDVEAGTRYRALAGLGLAREEQKEWKAALGAYEAVAGRSPDATLREWARERATAMKNQLKTNGTAPAQKRSEPPAKPSGDKSSGRRS
jgi:TolA-binding protein